MSRIAKSTRAAPASSFSASVEAPGAADLDGHALGLVVAALRGHVDPRVHGVGREVEQQRRRPRSGGRLLAGAAAAARGAARREERAARPRHGDIAAAARMVAPDAPPGHLLAQLHALALADVPLLLQVLRVRDAPAAPARARRGRAAARPAPPAAASRSCWCSPARRPRSPPGRRARGCASSGFEDFIAYVVWACERALERGLLPHTNLGVARARGPGPAARGHRLPGADARVGQPRPGRPPGLADQAPRRCGWRRSAPPASCGSRSRAGSSSASARPRTTGSRRSRRSAGLRTAHPGGDPPELRPAPALLRRGAGRDRRPTAAERYWRTGHRPTAPHARPARSGRRPVTHRRHGAAGRARRGG